MINRKNNLEKILSNGKLVKKLNVSNNNVNSEAYLYSWLSDQYVIRKVGKQYNLSTKQLIELEKCICIYYKLLKKSLPTNLPKIFFTKINREQNCVFLITEYFPKRKVSEITNRSTKIKHFKEIIKLIIKLSNSRNNLFQNKLICSIDSNPENFFLDSRNQIIYNDFTPPLYRKDGEWFEFRRRDEVYAKKSEKEKRYFTGLNVLLAFINKTRIYLTLSDYSKLIKWLSDKIQKSHFSTKSNLGIFPEIYNKIYSKKVIEFSKFEKYAVRRDLLRFVVSFREDLASDEIKEIYKKSKKPDGVTFLEKQLKNI